MAEVIIIIVAVAQLIGLGNWSPVLSLAQRTARTPVALSHYETVALPSGSPPELNLTATSALAIDASTGEALYSKNPDKAVPIASLTKIFTILVVLRDHSLDETVTVPALPPYEPGAVLLGAPTGSKFRLGDLLKAALMPSDNDAADTLAIYDAGSVKAFTDKMNGLMKDWGISGLHFASANGLEDAGNYATTRTLSQAARLLITNQSVRAITGTTTDTISDTTGRSYPLHSTNELLQTPGFYGIKTGYTPLAGQCLVARASVHGHDVISVVLGSQDRFGETKTLINAISQGYTWH